MEKYRGPAIMVTLALLVGAALSETFLKVTWSPGLLALVGVPLAAVFADQAVRAIKSKSEQATQELLDARKKEEEKP